MEDFEILDRLELILIELDARLSSNNCPYTRKTWEEICNAGIDLFEQLKKIKEQ